MAQDAPSCEQAGDFQVCQVGNSKDDMSVRFSDGTIVDIYKDHLFFEDTGSSYNFSDQLPVDARQFATSCLFTPAGFQKRSGKIPENWRMKSAADYWKCLMAEKLDLENTISQMNKHKDLSSFANNSAYLDATANYLHEHFGSPRFNVYTLSQREEAYRALHKRKWN
jgi:hypothetical protein